MFISTNGTLITADIARILSKYKNAEVFVSIDGPNALYNLNRIHKDGTPMYPQIVQGIQNLQDAGVYTGIFMVATQQNSENITAVIQEIKHKFSPVIIGYNLPHWTKQWTNIVDDERYGQALVKLYENKNIIDIPIIQLNWRLRPLIEGKVKIFSCGLHTTQRTMLPDGSIVRCLKIDKDPSLSYITDNYLDINCPIKLNQDSKSQCYGCIAVGCCGGGCPFDGLKRYNTAIDRRECTITPVIVEKAIKNLIQSLEKNTNIDSGLLTPDFIKACIL